MPEALCESRLCTYSKSDSAATMFLGRLLCVFFSAPVNVDDDSAASERELEPRHISTLSRYFFSFKDSRQITGQQFTHSSHTLLPVIVQTEIVLLKRRHSFFPFPQKPVYPKRGIQSAAGVRPSSMHCVGQRTLSKNSHQALRFPQGLPPKINIIHIYSQLSFPPCVD